MGAAITRNTKKFIDDLILYYYDRKKRFDSQKKIFEEEKHEFNVSVIALERIGDRLPDFTAKCLDGSTFTLSDNTGKITVIHLWATYSKDSIEGLRELDAFCREQGDKVAAIAVHNHYGSGKAAEYAKDIDIPVAIDNGDEEIIITNLFDSDLSVRDSSACSR